MKRKIRIATWNVGQDLENGAINNDSFEYIKAMVEQYEIDLIAFQEAITESIQLPALSQYISENTKLKYAEEISLSPTDLNGEDRMGVAICSKFKIDKTEKFILDNPRLTYKEYWSHDKGFTISKINEIDTVVIQGHCLPFHVFKESPLNYKNIFLKLQEKILSEIKKEKNVILMGDFNYTNIFELLPKLKEKMNCVYENEKTRKDKQFDYILTTQNIEAQSYKILKLRFDHALCIVDIIINI